MPENIKGLTQEEVQQRVDQGQVNISPKPIVKSNRQIILGHAFNFFNIYNFVIAFFLFIVKEYTSLFFVNVIIMNICIRSYQEIRSKKTVESLNLIISLKSRVLRDGQLISLSNEEIVMDDIVYIETGNQIAADSILLDDEIEVDESMLTGESDSVRKFPEQQLLSASYVVSGGAYCRVNRVGKNNYAYKITEEARKPKVAYSELMDTFNKVSKIACALIIPIGVLLVFQAMILRGQDLRSTVANSSTALLDLVPKGLILLTSLSMGLGVVRLGKKETLVQDMYSIETLSKIDVLCIDKTGTLTQGKMRITEVEEIDRAIRVNDIMQTYLAYSKDNNSTFHALKDYYGSEKHFEFVKGFPFSSKRKWGAISLVDIGTIVVGAPKFVMKDYVVDEAILKEQAKGARVLLVARSREFMEHEEDQLELEPLAVIVIFDPIREEVTDTLNFFKENEVCVKVISGDALETVCAIASQAGIDHGNKGIDISNIKDEAALEEAIMNYNVIARASPHQKQKLVQLLQKNQQKVAMVGDGVNDVLALKSADCSIAMGSGSDAAKQVSQVILLNSDFTTMKDVVLEGRTVVNNISRSAAMYYLKIIYTAVLSVIAIFLNIPYPFIPVQLTLMNMFIEGLPSTVVTFDNNAQKPKESILSHVMRFSFPSAITICVMFLVVQFAPYSIDVKFTMFYFITGFLSLTLIYRIFKPLNWWTVTVLIVDVLGFILACYVFWDFLHLVYLTKDQMIVTGCLIVISAAILYVIIKVTNHFVNKHEKRLMRRAYLISQRVKIK